MSRYQFKTDRTDTKRFKKNGEFGRHILVETNRNPWTGEVEPKKEFRLHATKGWRVGRAT